MKRKPGGLINEESNIRTCLVRDPAYKGKGWRCVGPDPTGLGITLDLQRQDIILKKVRNSDSILIEAGLSKILLSNEIIEKILSIDSEELDDA